MLSFRPDKKALTLKLAHTRSTRLQQALATVHLQRAVSSDNDQISLLPARQQVSMLVVQLVYRIQHLHMKPIHLFYAWVILLCHCKHPTIRTLTTVNSANIEIDTAWTMIAVAS